MQNGKEKIEEDEAEQAEAGGALRSIDANTTLSQYASFAGSKFAPFVYDVVQQTQTFVETLLPLISEIDAGAVEIREEVQRCRELWMDRKCKLEQERERFQQAACTVLEMLNKSSHTNTSALTVYADPAMTQEEDSRQTQD
ncbi:hypothetical protein SUGI_1204120 [Cryptomeria japonica]|uniref:uncharacterized protein LOC131061382 n=1 Tax=Cryptomeria japonica TaxID=3369 RepID=UPI002414CE80|nr:uncharacterized protein LOC131061382 [Cryptomeria japonica]GLJ56090.1 hypothetical protein SUGI_1204120 [Cryptomeria japonica]